MGISKSSRVLSSLTVCLGGFSQGAMLSWSAPVLPQLSNPFRSEIGWVAENTISWIAAISFIGSMLGSLLSLFLLKYIGTKPVIGFSSLLASLSWLAVGLADSALILILGRISLGCSNAILMSVIPSYIFTVAPPCSRGSLTCCYSLAMGLGLIFSVTLGVHVTWGPLSLAAGIAPLILFLSTPLLVSSPAEDPTSLHSLVHPLTRPPTVKQPLLLLMYLAVMFVFSGVCPLSVFPELILSDRRTVDTDSVVMVSMVCQLVGMMMGAIFIDRVGRKPVLQVGGWVTLFSNILLSIYFSTEGPEQLCPVQPGSVLCWTPAIATCIFFLGFGGGLGSIFFVLMAEVVPTKSQARIIPLTTFCLNLLQFAVIKSFIHVVSAVGLTNLFFIQGAFCIFLLVGQSAWVPETRVVHSNIASVDQDTARKDSWTGRGYGTFFSSIKSFHKNRPNPTNTDFTLDNTEFHVTISDLRAAQATTSGNSEVTRKKVTIVDPSDDTIDVASGGQEETGDGAVGGEGISNISTAGVGTSNRSFVSDTKGNVAIIEPSGNVVIRKNSTNKKTGSRPSSVKRRHSSFCVLDEELDKIRQFRT